MSHLDFIPQHRPDGTIVMVIVIRRENPLQWLLRVLRAR